MRPSGETAEHLITDQTVESCSVSRNTMVIIIHCELHIIFFLEWGVESSVVQDVMAQW